MRPRARTTSSSTTSSTDTTSSRPTAPTRRPRSSRSLLGAALAAVGGVGLAVGAPLAASAHVELDASSTVPATISVLTFAVGHGCEGSATTALAVEFPATVQAVTPTVKPGWEITRATSGAADAATDAASDAGTDGAAGAATTGGATTVTWTASDPLPDGFRDTVQVQALLPVDGAAGDVVTFPTVQTCEEGSYDWVEPPADDGSEPASPAPVLTLTDASTAGAGDAGAGSTAELGVAAVAADTAAPVDGTARLLGTGALVVGGVAVVLLTTVLRRGSGDARRATGSDR